MRPARRRGRLGLVALIAVLVSTAVAHPVAAQPSLELAVKATDLYKFAAFVEWPAAAFAGPAEPAVLCVAGDDPFGPLLDQAVRDQKIDGRTIKVMRLPAEALREVRGEPVLTITDGAGDPNARGMIDFVLREGRVRFRIDPRMAERSGLLISSKLLSLAVKP